MLNSKSLFAFSFLFLVIVAARGDCQQQYYLVQLRGDDDGSEKMQEILDAENDAVVRRLNVWVQDIDRICELSKEQERKLRVVVKGAAGKRNEARKKEIEAQFKRFTDRNQAINFTVMSKSPRDVDSEEIWTKTLDKILDEEQGEKYRKWQDERLQFQRRALVDQFVAEIDQSLFLSGEQREKMSAVIEKNFGDRFVADANSGRIRIRRGQIQSTPDPRYVELVQEFLNENQLEEWKQTIEPILQR